MKIGGSFRLASKRLGSEAEAFLVKMGIFKKKKKSEQKAGTPTDDAEEKNKEKDDNESESQAPNDCSQCKGAGLLGDPAGRNERCGACNGTGKETVSGQYPEGTKIFKQDGQYLVQNGVLVKQ